MVEVNIEELLVTFKSTADRLVAENGRLRDAVAGIPILEGKLKDATDRLALARKSKQSLQRVEELEQTNEALLAENEGFKRQLEAARNDVSRLMQTIGDDQNLVRLAALEDWLRVAAERLGIKPTTGTSALMGAVSDALRRMVSNRR